MLKHTDYKVETFVIIVKNFQHDNLNYSERIHCIIKEYITMETYGEPTSVIVEPIKDLKNFVITGLQESNNDFREFNIYEITVELPFTP